MELSQFSSKVDHEIKLSPWIQQRLKEEGVCKKLSLYHNGVSIATRTTDTFFNISRPTHLYMVQMYCRSSECIV